MRATDDEVAWEYDHVWISEGRDRDQIGMTERLNEWGEGGWELIGSPTFIHWAGGSRVYECTFKRPKE